MNVSFSGVLSTYLYNCPHAHRLRNIEKNYLPRKEADEEPEGISAREFGIEQHDLIAAYILKKVDTYEHSTDLIEWFRNQPNPQVEVQRYYDLDGTCLASKPVEGDYISTRIDALVCQHFALVLADWKFGNPDYGAAKYYDETCFFLAMLGGEYPDIGEFETVVHFPIYDYSLPKRKYTIFQLARLQTSYRMRIEQILNDKMFKPKPSKQHCRFCDQRSEEAGGTGVCTYSVM